MPFISNPKDGVGKKRKKKKKTGKEVDEDSDEDVFSDFSDVSDEEDEEIDEDDSPKSKPNPRKMLQRTWSVNAFNVSTHSAGVVYLDDSDGSETDDDSSCYDEFGEEEFDGEITNNEEDDENTTSKKKKKKKRTKGDKKKKKKRSSKKSNPGSQFKKEMKHRNQLSSIIPECDEFEEETEAEDMSHTNNDEIESEDDSPMCYHTPFSFKGRPPSISQLMAEEDKKVESGYSSDSALVRKRMQMLQAEQKKQSTGKKKGGKKKAPKKKRSSGLESSARSGGGSLEGDNSTATTLSVESLEEARQADETDNETVTTKGGRKKKKKKPKKKKNKDSKPKKKRAVISFLVDGDDDACADFDKRLEEIEQFEASLVEERKAIQKERETMAFERESMEMRMDEEAQQCDELKLRIKELEQLVQSQQISNAGNVVESTEEKNGLKLDFMREKREYHIQLTEKDREIEDLKLEVRDLKMLKGAVKSEDESNNMVDGGKSRERLQGELLQTVAKLSEKEAQFNSQSKELELAREEVAALKAGKETTELKNLILVEKEENIKLQQAMENERQENAAKLKDKDETVTFLMNELARLKMAQSTAKRRLSFK